MTKTFDSICQQILGETIMTPTTPQQGQQPQQQQPGQPNQPPQPQTAIQNNMDYKKMWETVSKLAPDHLQQLATDLANHLKTAATQQPAQPQNAANKQV